MEKSLEPAETWDGLRLGVGDVPTPGLEKRSQNCGNSWIWIQPLRIRSELGMVGASLCSKPWEFCPYADEPHRDPSLREFPLFPPPFGASISWNEVLVSLLPRGLEGNLLLQILGIFRGIFGKKTSQGDFNVRTWVGKIHARDFSREKDQGTGLGDFSSSGSDPGVFSGVLFPNKFLSLQGNKSKSKLDLLGRENVLGGGESTLQAWNFHGAFIEEK